MTKTLQSWHKSLPALLSKYVQRWDLEIAVPFENLSYNYAAPVTRADGTLAVIKTGFSCEGLRAEIAALRHFAGRGMVHLYEADADDCIFLLERVSPGESLWDVDDKQATDILLDLMPKLWKPYRGEYPFPTVADWGKGFVDLRTRHHGVLDAKLVDKAENLFADLLSSSDEAVLLHGDLHQGNLLSATREFYLAIDPKGVLGEPCYEVGTFLRNPASDLLKRENPRALLMRRIDRIVERLGFDSQRVTAWGMAQAVLAAIWCEEDQLPCGAAFMAIAELLSD